MLLNMLKSGKNPPDEVNVVIEIPKGSSVKYEMDAESGAIFVDRKLFTAMFYPCNYGFIPQTMEDDGDPVDVLVLGNDPVMPMSVIQSNPIGILLTEDEEGQDSKIIASPIIKIDPSFSYIRNIDNVPSYVLGQIKHFFEHYKELEAGKYVKVIGWDERDIARRKITEAMERYKLKKDRN